MRSVLFLLAIVCIGACDAPPVEWTDPKSIPSIRDGRLIIDTGGARYVDAPAALSISAPGICPSSVRSARAGDKTRTVWWGLRADSSAVLYLAETSDSGRTWSKPVSVDTADVGAIGCTRPAPSVAAVGDDLHVAYSMKASEGTGVFFAHFLGSMVHAPVAVIYGDRLVRTAIAAEGNRVAVAYEQPNGSRRRVDVALSSTQGHIFETHTTASRDIDEAVDPAVALAGSRIAVSWTSPPAEGSTAPGDTVSRVVRVGRIH